MDMRRPYRQRNAHLKMANAGAVTAWPSAPPAPRNAGRPRSGIPRGRIEVGAQLAEENDGSPDTSWGFIQRLASERNS
jgi:hypothetical protein